MTTLEFGSLELGSLVLPPLTFRSARDWPIVLENFGETNTALFVIRNTTGISTSTKKSSSPLTRSSNRPRWKPFSGTVLLILPVMSGVKGDMVSLKLELVVKLKLEKKVTSDHKWRSWCYVTVSSMVWGRTCTFDYTQGIVSSQWVGSSCFLWFWTKERTACLSMINNLLK
jgi:hypothetical protein